MKTTWVKEGLSYPSAPQHYCVQLDDGRSFRIAKVQKDGPYWKVRLLDTYSILNMGGTPNAEFTCLSTAKKWVADNTKPEDFIPPLDASRLGHKPKSRFVGGKMTINPDRIKEATTDIEAAIWDIISSRIDLPQDEQHLAIEWPKSRDPIVRIEVRAK